MGRPHAAGGETAAAGGVATQLLAVFAPAASSRDGDRSSIGAASNAWGPHSSALDREALSGALRPLPLRLPSPGPTPGPSRCSA